MTCRALLLFFIVFSGACSKQIGPAKPSVDFSAPVYRGFDETLRDQLMRVGPGALIGWFTDWSGLCAYDDLYDSISQERCDEQSYTLNVVCDGVPCSTHPADALGEKGHHAHGSLSVSLDAKSAGTLVATATITRGTMSVFDTQILYVVEPDSLVLECEYSPGGHSAHTACPMEPSAYLEGATFFFYVYGKKGAQRIDVGADFAIDGFTYDPDGTRSHDSADLIAPSPGTHTLTASFHGLSASYTVTLN